MVPGGGAQGPIDGLPPTPPLAMVTTSIQDRTAEFRAVLAQAQKKQSSTKGGAQRQSLLTDAQRRAANGSPNGDVKGGKRGARSEFARRAADIGRGITGTMEKLERLAQCKRLLLRALAHDGGVMRPDIWETFKAMCDYDG